MTRIEDQFFVVWNPAHGVPTFRHDTREAATSEAKRLARLSPGQKFYVLMGLCSVEMTDPIQIVELNDGIPF